MPDAAYRFIIALVIAVASLPAFASEKVYLSLYADCRATGGPVMLQQRRDPVLYPFYGSRQTRRYLACINGNNGWNDTAGGLFDGCRAFPIASYAVGCSGGVVPAPAFYAGFPRDMASNKLGLFGNALAVALRPPTMVVPFNQQDMERALAAATRYSPLLPGYAPIPPEASFTTIPWDDERNLPLIPVIGSVSAPSETIHEIPTWLALIGGSPGQWVLLAAIAAYVGIAALGFYSPPGSRGWFFGLAIAAGVAAHWVAECAETPFYEQRAIQAQAAAITASNAALDAKYAQLRDVVYAGGTLAPLTPDAFERVRALTSPERASAPAATFQDPVPWAIFSLILIGTFLTLYATRFAAGYYYLFRRPKIVDIVSPALRGEPLDMKAATAAMKPDPAEARDPPPAYQSHSDAMHMDDLAKKLRSAPPPPRYGYKEQEARQSAYRAKQSAWSRLRDAIFGRRRQEYEAQHPEPPPIPTEDEQRLREAKHRRDEAQRAYEAELKRNTGTDTGEGRGS